MSAADQKAEYRTWLASQAEDVKEAAVEVELQEAKDVLGLDEVDAVGAARRGRKEVEGMSREELEKLAIQLEEEMFAAAEELRFEYAAKLRDEIKDLPRELQALAPA